MINNGDVCALVSPLSRFDEPTSLKVQQCKYKLWTNLILQYMNIEYECRKMLKIEGRM